MKKTKINVKDHLEKIYSFSMIVKSGSITEAARRINISQAALSRSMLTLEEAVSSKLFIRNRSGVQLTEAGKILYEFSKKLISDVNAVELNLDDKSQSDCIKLRVGTHEALAIYFWPSFLEQFKKLHPEIIISLMSGRIHYLAQGLQNRDFNLILTVEPMEHPQFKIFPLFENSFRFYKGPKKLTSSHFLLRKNELTLRELNQLPILTDINAHLSQSQSVSRFLLQMGLTLDNLFELNSFEAAIRLASNGLGIAILPELIGEDAVNRFGLQRLSINGFSNKSFGLHKVCATILKQEEDFSFPVYKLLNSLTTINK